MSLVDMYQSFRGISSLISAQKMEAISLPKTFVTVYKTIDLTNHKTIILVKGKVGVSGAII